MRESSAPTVAAAVFFLLVFCINPAQTLLLDTTFKLLQFVLPSQLSSSTPVNWSPKTDPKTYDPRTKNWRSVASACEAAISYERRLANFYIRSAFHDSAPFDLTKCATGSFGNSNCKAALSSLFLSIAEMSRPENAYDDFSKIASRSILKIASWYDISACDALSICSSVAVRIASGGAINPLAGGLRVGCMDSLTASTAGQLPNTTISLQAFADFFKARGLTLEQGIALMGTHALVDKQGCLRGPRRDQYCDISAGEKCDDVRMFKLQNHYYHDACASTLKVTTGVPMRYLDNPIRNMTDGDFDSLTNREQCKFTSKAFRTTVVAQLTAQRIGDIPAPPDQLETEEVHWSNKNCIKSSAPNVDIANVCPHATNWYYTVIDAKMGMACQGVGSDPLSVNVRNIMRNFLTSSNWATVTSQAFRDMLTKTRAWAETYVISLLGIKVLDAPVYSYGKECNTRFSMNAVCYNATGGRTGPEGWKTCDGCKLLGTNCHSCCICHMEFVYGKYALNQTESQEKLMDLVIAPEAMNPDPTGVTMPTMTMPDQIEPQIPENITPANPTPGTTLAAIPKSPYDTEGSCSVTTTPVNVRGFPSSPFPIKNIFTKEFVNPPKASEKLRTKDAYGNSIAAYEFDVVNCEADFAVGCPAAVKTALLCYGGISPGATIEVKAGEQTILRFNNKINNFTVHPDYPELCKHNTNKFGRPLAVHAHGMASLAPYDGWAEDTFCQNETKDYVYPNNRPTTGWYHDHQLEITSDNAHAGLAGFYFIKNNSAVGSGPDLWGMDNMEELHLMLADKVMDSKCQLRYEKDGPHKNSHFGDINLVSGQAFPKKTVQAKWYRFRFLNAAVSRPYLVSVVNSKGEEISSSICQVVGSDGGYRRLPVAFPSKGMFIGVAERYDVVCNFAGLQGQTLYLWNTKDERRMKDVPFYCHSHLLMKFTVTECTLACTSAAKFDASPARVPNYLDRVLGQNDQIAAVTARVLAGNGCDRTFKFGRRNGQWVINGETWHTARVAAKDVGHNTAEVWCLESGGGWFHPIHIHLIDMYVIARFSSGQYQTEESYEMEVPKDVVSLHPGSKVAILAVWGPHRGEYMIHCHNLVHEDLEMMRSYNNSNMHHLAPARTQRDYMATISKMTFQNEMGMMYDNYKNPEYPGAYAKQTTAVGALNATRVQSYLDMQLYRIFYPGSNERVDLCNRDINPWLVRPCT